MFKGSFSVLLAIVVVGSLLLIACKKDNGETDTGTKACKDKPVGTVFSEIPNLDFEEWVSGSGAGGVKYETPAPKSFWATPNLGSGTIIPNTLTVPVTVFKVEGSEARTGYAAMLKTSQTTLFNEKKLVAGSIASGEFEVDITDPLNSMKFGKNFNRRPSKVSGYYRYYPVLGDSASVYCFVTKYDANCKLDTLGFGRVLFYDQQDSYARFEFNVEYKNNNTETPDRVVFYFSSSEAGDKFLGQPGNTLYIDDVAVEYHN